MGIEALLTSQVIGLDAALTGKLNTSGGTVTGQLTNALGTITASTPLTISQTWNNAAVSFNPLLVSVTDTQSASGSLLMDLQVGGNSIFNVRRAYITGSKYDRAVVSIPQYSYISSRLTGGFVGFGVDESTVNFAIDIGSTSGVRLISGGYLAWNNSASNVPAGTNDLFLYRDAANTLAQRNSTNAQTFRLANTYTSATSFENLQLQWSSNEARIGTSVGSAGGTQRSLVLGTWDSAGAWFAILSANAISGDITTGANLNVGGNLIWKGGYGGDGSYWYTPRLSLVSGLNTWNTDALLIRGTAQVKVAANNGLAVRNNADSADAAITAAGATLSGQLTNALGTITASTPATFTQTWNNVATTFTSILANVTDTASASGSLLLDLQVGGSSRLSVRKDSQVAFSGVAWEGKTLVQAGYTTIGWGLSAGNWYWGSGTGAGTWKIGLHQSHGVQVFQQLGFNNDAAGSPSDLILVRDAARTLAIRDGVNANVLNIYNTYTSSTSYERGKIAWESNVLKIGTEKGSAGGSARALELQTDGTTRLTVASASPTVTIGTAVGTGILQFGVNTTGDLKVSSATLTQLSINQRGEFGVSSSVDGQWRITAWNATNPILCFQGITSSFPAIKRNSAAINFRLADDSADCDITAKAATFSGNVTVSAVNLVTDTTTGTKIGTGTTQKIGFYDKTPVVQPTAVADATDAASVITQLNALLSRMRDLGLIAT